MSGRRRELDREGCWDLPAEAVIAAKAREITRGTLSSRGLAALIDDVVLMVDELVVNAVVHGQGPLQLCLRVDREAGTDGARGQAALVCEVTDASPHMPRARGGRELDENGRGLQVVAVLADEFGIRRYGRGKVVWFRVPAAPGGGAAAGPRRAGELPGRCAPPGTGRGRAPVAPQGSEREHAFGAPARHQAPWRRSS